MKKNFIREEDKKMKNTLLADEHTRKLQEISCQQRRETRIPYTFRIRYPEGSRFATFAYPVTRKMAKKVDEKEETRKSGNWREKNVMKQ